ncbi:formyltransferase family protein [Spongiivirga sp. MCCC 1A20706]|uniref:formyltransferase family protein n=1 Tax=Spongiivirga sp. MCCC 1A20706 TaxID=3160963 RepID=UPI0039773F7B
MLIQILVDNPNSWIIPYIKELINTIKSKFGYSAVLLHDHDQVITGEILCLLSCEKIFKALHLNKHNLVVHESDLPKGKGWSPVTWQVLEGKKEIPVTLFEASKKVDAGEIYFQKNIKLIGHELIDEIKDIQGAITNELIIKFLENYPGIKGTPQIGEETFYKKRTPSDSELDIEKSIKEQFDLLRVCDNERYPAFFVHNTRKYIIKIYNDHE